MGKKEGKTETALILRVSVARHPMELTAQWGAADAEGKQAWEVSGLTEWEGGLDLKGLIKQWCGDHVAIPDQIIPPISLRTVFVGYTPEPLSLTFICKMNLFEVLFTYFKEKKADAGKEEKIEAGYLLGLEVTEPIVSGLAKVAIIGSFLDEFSIDQLKIFYASENLERRDILRPKTWDIPGPGYPKGGPRSTFTPDSERKPLGNIGKGFSLSARIGSEAYRQEILLRLSEERVEDQKEKTPLPPGAPGGNAKATKESTEPGAHPPTKGPAIPGAARKWFPVHKVFGPLHVQKIGGEWKDGRLGLLLDAAIDLSGLTVGLTGFCISLPLADFIKDPDPRKLFDKDSIRLDGLEISYRGGGPVEITGSFVRHEIEKVVGGRTLQETEYSGMALIRAKQFTLSAMGSFGSVNGKPSLFVYAFYQGALGGPVCFVVQGIAAGFGYNREIKLPSVEEVRKFPLVALAVSPDPKKGPEGVLSELIEGGHIPPALGQYWFAVGIKFTSFKLIESFALLSIAFGTRVEFALLGISTLRQPAGSKDPVAYVEMALKIRFSPDDGLLAAKAVLTPNSYILSKACKLTGGFAFYVWFSGEHEGDFVVTLGGYHPQFAIPSHYPAVDRLGFNWKIGSDITIKGECYFALTPSSIMAGGRLSAVYEHGRFRAWFIAYADFLIQWEPFHYDIGIGVSIGASYRMSIFGISHTFSIELGAQLHLWGPPFAGTARISWWIISFTICFGAHDQRPQKGPISWDHFRRSFLPQSKDELAKPDPIQVGITGGMIKESKGSNGDKFAVVNPDQLVLTVQSAVPVTAIHLNGNIEKEPATYEKNLGVRPMEAIALESSLIIALKKEDKGDSIEMKMKRVTKGVPEALWSPRPAAERLNKMPVKQVINNVLTGAQFSVPEPKEAPRKIAIDLSQRGFSKHREDVFVRKAPKIELEPTYDEETALERLASSMRDAQVQLRREAILEALGGLGFKDLTSGVNLVRTAESVNQKDTLLAPPIFEGMGKRRQRQIS